MITSLPTYHQELRRYEPGSVRNRGLERKHDSVEGVSNGDAEVGTQPGAPGGARIGRYR